MQPHSEKRTNSLNGNTRDSQKLTQRSNGTLHETKKHNFNPSSQNHAKENKADNKAEITLVSIGSSGNSLKQFEMMEKKMVFDAKDTPVVV